MLVSVRVVSVRCLDPQAEMPTAATASKHGTNPHPPVGKLTPITGPISEPIRLGWIGFAIRSWLYVRSARRSQGSSWGTGTAIRCISVTSTTQRR